ncbi:SDR family oxidoreductase [Novosphingobium sp.]|uniref:SDR family oxidoreductase n=1 Tax=Novosphingobium sp. TaxID=1874826 RepID=UPI002FDE510C
MNAGAGGRLAGKTCFVTGGAQGIGRAVAIAFAHESARVIAADLRFAEPFADGSGITTCTLDVTDADAVAIAAAAHPEASVLVNCVGYVANGSILDGSIEDLDRSMTLNVRSMALTIRAFLPAMLVRGDGAIINIASVVSSVMAAPNRFAYATSKAAVVGLTMSVARDFIASGIRCNAISPGTVESPSLLDRFAATGDAAAAREAFIARQPMGRLGQPEEIAAIAVTLASDEARFMSGTNVVIDGGMSL